MAFADLLGGRLIVDPTADLVRLHADPDFVPLVVVKIAKRCRVVFASISAVNATDTDDTTTPATKNEADVVLTNRKRQAAEKIEAIGPPGLEFKFVVLTKQVTFPANPGQRIAETKLDQLVRDFDRAITTELADHPGPR